VKRSRRFKEKGCRSGNAVICGKVGNNRRSKMRRRRELCTRVEPIAEWRAQSCCIDK